MLVNQHTCIRNPQQVNVWQTSNAKQNSYTFKSIGLKAHQTYVLEHDDLWHYLSYTYYIRYTFSISIMHFNSKVDCGASTMKLEAPGSLCTCYSPNACHRRNGFKSKPSDFSEEHLRRIDASHRRQFYRLNANSRFRSRGAARSLLISGVHLLWCDVMLLGRWRHAGSLRWT